MATINLQNEIDLLYKKGWVDKYNLLDLLNNKLTKEYNIFLSASLLMDNINQYMEVK